MTKSQQGFFLSIYNEEMVREKRHLKNLIAI